MSATLNTVDNVNHDFLAAYGNFLNEQRQHSIHPLKDSIQHIIQVRDNFMNLFSEAPETMKPLLAISPLFPTGVKFRAFEESRDNTRPLDYIMLTAHVEALRAIEKYVLPQDWLRLGPYGSTYMHYLIAGIKKHSIAHGGKPIECAIELLKKFPLARYQPNLLEATPLGDLLEIKEKHTDVIDESTLNSLNELEALLRLNEIDLFSVSYPMPGLENPLKRNINIESSN